MIELAYVSKRYGAKLAVDDVTFRVPPGRVTGFLGPNGAGKSATLRILLGLDRADSGTAHIDGKPYRDLRHPLRKVGALLDGAGPVPERRAIDHLRWIAQSNMIPRRRVSEVLDIVGLSGARKQQVRKFSLGMGQRLGLAAALLGDPEILILDEPINGLDPDGIRWVRTFLKDYAREGRTVLLSSHLMTEMAETADDVIMIAGGRIAAHGPLADVTAGHPSLESAFFALTGDANTGR